MGKQLKVLALIFTVLIFATACGSGEDAAQKPQVQLGNIEYEIVDVNSDEFKDLYSDSEFEDWYEAGYKEEGVTSFDVDDNRYILLSAGEKSTGGYLIDNIVLTGTEDSVEVTAELHAPAEGSPVIQSVTYPNLMVRTALDERQLAFEDFEVVIQEAVDQELTDTGSYVGLIDANSVEIKISGVPDEQAAKAFQLDAAIAENFEENFNLQSGDEVKVTYFVDQFDRAILTQIEKL